MGRLLGLVALTRLSSLTCLLQLQFHYIIEQVLDPVRDWIYHIHFSTNYQLTFQLLFVKYNEHVEHWNRLYFAQHYAYTCSYTLVLSAYNLCKL